MRTKRSLHTKVIQRERKRKADAEADAVAAAREAEEDAGAGEAAFCPGPPGKRTVPTSEARAAAAKAAAIGDGLLNEGRYRCGVWWYRCGSGCRRADHKERGSHVKLSYIKTTFRIVRDKGLYISHVKDGTNVDDTFMMEEQNMELQAAVMDLTAEDKAGIEDQKRQYHWDKRHKKYVQLGAHETVKAGKRVRTESGKVRLRMA